MAITPAGMAALQTIRPEEPAPETIGLRTFRETDFP